MRRAVGRALVVLFAFSLVFPPLYAALAPDDRPAAAGRPRAAGRAPRAVYARAVDGRTLGALAAELERSVRRRPRR